jgi:hypothetical protein
LTTRIERLLQLRLLFLVRRLNATDDRPAECVDKLDSRQAGDLGLLALRDLSAVVQDNRSGEPELAGEQFVGTREWQRCIVWKLDREGLNRATP